MDGQLIVQCTCMFFSKCGYNIACLHDDANYFCLITMEKLTKSLLVVVCYPRMLYMLEMLNPSAITNQWFPEKSKLTDVYIEHIMDELKQTYMKHLDFCQNGDTRHTFDFYITNTIGKKWKFNNVICFAAKKGSNPVHISFAKLHSLIQG
ncbi:hypothetical protein MAR_001861 [Mya arenaria]|uniref:Uncharacterized protein n=1 Tax=Mya arenaria TaxID=6604 RepID=A0ABY7FCP9_MYAAR|nr:hypothetical protein MAR_000792 [Mya arenaria]WAR20023.1 hypothetical protein MAR_001861 [Mya arenaria]